MEITITFNPTFQDVELTIAKLYDDTCNILPSKDEVINQLKAQYYLYGDWWFLNACDKVREISTFPHIKARSKQLFPELY